MVTLVDIDKLDIYFHEFAEITDGNLRALIVPTKAYPDLSILFQEPLQLASLEGYWVDPSLWHWCQVFYGDLITEDGSPRGDIERIVIAFLSREIIHYYNIWVDIMKEQGKSCIVYSDSPLGKAISRLLLPIRVVVHHQLHLRRYM